MKERKKPAPGPWFLTGAAEAESKCLLNRGGGFETTQGLLQYKQQRIWMANRKEPTTHSEGKEQGGGKGEGRKADDEASHQQLIVTKHLPWAMCYSKPVYLTILDSCSMKLINLLYSFYI